MQSITKAVLPVAGLGTRFLPATKSIPKEMLPLVDRPCLDYIITEAVEAGIGDLILITAPGKGAIDDHFSPSPVLEKWLIDHNKQALLKEVQRASTLAKVINIKQHEAKGLGHAVLTAKPAVGKEPFAVLLGDDVIDNWPSPNIPPFKPAIQQLIEARDHQHDTVIALLEVPKDQVNRYGICGGDLIQDRMHVTSMVEKPPIGKAPSNFSIVGRYILPFDIFEILENTDPGWGGEIQLTDAILALAAQNRVLGLNFNGARFDTGNVLGLIRATLHFGLKRPELSEGIKDIIRELGF